MRRKYNFDAFDEEEDLLVVEEVPSVASVNLVRPLCPVGHESLDQRLREELEYILSLYTSRKEERGITDTPWLECVIKELMRVLCQQNVIFGADGVGFNLGTWDTLEETTVALQYRPSLQRSVCELVVRT